MKKKLIKAGAFLLVVGVFCYCFFVVAPDKDTAALVYNNSYKDMSFSVFDYPEAADGETELKQMHLMEENNQYALYLDENLSDIALVDKKTGRIYHSNPCRKDPSLLLGKANQYEFTSLVTIDYINSSGKTGTFTSAEHALTNKQVWVKKIESGIRLTYQMGSAESSRLLPPVLTEDSYQEILQKMEDADRESMEEFYRYLESGQLPAEQAEELVELVPGVENQNLYLLRTLTASQKRMLESMLEEVGFTVDQMEEEKKKTEYVGDENSISFVIPLELRVEEDGLLVSVPAQDIQMPKSVKIRQISLLKGFGASSQKEGFLLIPDGSGALLDRVSNSSNDVLAKPLYGRDITTSVPYISEISEQAVLPFFGQRSEQDALFGYIVSGAPQASVIAKQISSSNFAATVYPSFIITELDYKVYDLTENSQSGILLANESVTEDLSVCYFPMEQEKATYSNMAERCREYLLKQGMLKDEKTQGSSFYLSLLGAAEKETTRFGIPVTMVEPLTTFQQAEEILSVLIDKGVSDIAVEYAGITEHGILGNNNGSFKPLSALGGKKEYQGLLQQTSQNGIRFFTAEEFLCVYQSQGFGQNQSLVRKISKQIASGSEWNPVTLRREKENSYSLRSPMTLLKIGEAFLKEYAYYSEAGISAPSIGKLLYSDYKKSAACSRTGAQQQYSALLEMFEKNVQNVMVHTGNSYALPYVTDILELPSGSSGEYLETESIPFVQQVLHGYVNYSSTPFNSTSDGKREFLKAIETGGAIYYQWMYAENELLYDVGVQNLYSLHFSDWLVEAVSFYQKAQPMFEQIQGVPIKKHQKLQSYVYATSYENGVTVLVNYSDSAVKINGISIDGQDFAVMEGNINAG